ncbi:MAG: hypothetical protein KF900_01425 [Bacteroidetes bacterium]|nr:hypothetical protein [Bacteroidota bacterium]
MQSSFDKTFENHKSTFRQKFGIEWNANHQLYVAYLQTIYVSTLAEIANSGLGQILSKQDDTHRLLQSISQKLDKRQ